MNSPCTAVLLPSSLIWEEKVIMNDELKLDEQWRGKEYSYFSHRKCEAFPCHETEDDGNFNCLFCYCVLYPLGRECGGDFRYLPNGVKDCSACFLPHDREKYGYIIDRFQDIVQKMKEE